ncbi:MAG: diguanylate cyclase [Pseudomonadota bacterium]
MANFSKSSFGLVELWSLTRFDDKALSEYSESKMFADTRRGVVMLGLVLLLLLVSSAIVYAILGYESIYVYSCLVLAALSIHVAISAHAVEEARILYLLGITLLVVNGVAFVLLAHYSGTFNSALFASVVFLFLVMPLVPWGLREALLIVTLIYALFTLSTLSVQGRFEHETLLILSCADPMAVVEQAAANLRTAPQLLSDDSHWPVQVSVGLVSIQPESGQSLDVIYRQADKALYQAKQTKGQDARSGRVVATVGV